MIAAIPRNWPAEGGGWIKACTNAKPNIIANHLKNAPQNHFIYPSFLSWRAFIVNTDPPITIRNQSTIPGVISFQNGTW
jgi:hypothetical protein